MRRGDPTLRGAAPGVPKNADCLAPLKRGARLPEGCRLPCLGGRGPIPLRLGARCSEERRLPGPLRRVVPDPLERGCRSSEEVRSPCPGGVGCRRLRRAIGSLSRGVGRRRLRRVVGSLSRWNWLAGPPKSAGCPVPVERGRPCSEEREVPCPGEVRRAVPRRAPSADPRWVGGLPLSREGGSLASRNGVPYLRRGRFPYPFGMGCRTSEEADFPVPLEPGAVPPKRSISLFRRGSAPGAPKSSACLTPSRLRTRCSEERRLLNPGSERSRSPSEEAARPCPGGT
jgi:hypothetical protein